MRLKEKDYFSPISQFWLMFDKCFFLQLEPASENTYRETSYSPVIQIKDEPIDEEYDKALMPSDMSRIKQELDSSENNENEVRFDLVLCCSICCENILVHM